MGSFSEIVLSFDFARETPDHVLAAFAALAAPGRSDRAPALPAPVVEAWDEWEPDWREAGYAEGDGDPYEQEPWRHDWASWVAMSMGIETTAHGMLRWSGRGTWNLDCRFSWKTDPVTASEALSWLAPYVDLTYSRAKVLVGYAHFGPAPRPQLFWVGAGRWELEDLNPDDEWRWS